MALGLIAAVLVLAGVLAGLAELFAGADLIPSASLEAAVLFCCTVFNMARVFWMIWGFCAQAIPAASVQTRMTVVRFIVSPYRFAGCPGLAAAPDGSRSWLKYVVAKHVATTLSLAAYW